jgi:hypothetical protein
MTDITVFAPTNVAVGFSETPPAKFRRTEETGAWSTYFNNYSSAKGRFYMMRGMARQEYVVNMAHYTTLGTTEYNYDYCSYLRYIVGGSWHCIDNSEATLWLVTSASRHQNCSP